MKAGPAIDANLLTPVWFDELHSGFGRRLHFAVSGNVRDLYPFLEGEGTQFLSFEQIVWRIAAQKGYAALFTYNPDSGLALHGECDGTMLSKLKGTGIALGEPAHTADEFADLHRSLIAIEDLPLVLLVDYATHLFANSASGLTDTLIEAHRSARISAMQEHEDTPESATIWLVDRPGDLPDWFTASNDTLREVIVELPNLEDRYAFAKTLIPHFAGSANPDEGEIADFLEQFALQADGMTLMGMRNVAWLSEDEGMGCAEIAEAIRMDRLGTRRNPWKAPVMRARVLRAEEILTRRIKGQKHAIQKALDILTRSIVGLSGAQTSSRHARPRGVLFLVGPTGVGKTELAKAVTELLFGDDTACHRFDMSEFMEENSINRLIGAPPGYPGYELGGELVNAMHKRPFSVVLFDEVEKAHPRILDMFLQILDEGRITDSRGSTAYFSEALIVFTSNIGMISGDRTRDAGMNILPSDDYKELERKLIEAVRDHFRLDLNRPELFNRLGQNIISFEFIDPEVGSEIFVAILGRVLDAVRAEHGVEIEIDPEVQEELRWMCMADWFEGGRGIANRIETHVINPLAREIFLRQPEKTMRITGVHEVDGRTVLDCS